MDPSRATSAASVAFSVDTLQVVDLAPGRGTRQLRPRGRSVPDGVVRGDDGVDRFWWCGADPLYRTYHDEEWGTPVHDDVRLFEKLCLEGFQSGLAWITILRKRENFRRAFRGFDPEKLVRFNKRSVARLLGDSGIVRHRGKIESVIHNARLALELRDEFGSLGRFIWRYEPEPRSRPVRLTRAALMQLTESDESRALARDLKQRGWRFVGPTTIYALMQSMGLVNDHLIGCATRERVERLRRNFRRPV